jgi:streptogramin lyase
VTQELDTSSIPGDWTVTYSDSGDNSIEIASFDDQNDWGSYDLEFTAVIGTVTELRTMSLTFEVYLSELCTTEAGPYQAAEENLYYTYEYDLYTIDPQAELTEIYYCDFNSGFDWYMMRGFTATFTNPHTGAYKTF